MFTVNACAGGDDRAPALVDLELPRATTVISTESGLLAGPSGIAVDGSGRVWVADFLAKRLVSVSPEGNDPLIVGREGQGPGEFSGPLGVVPIPGGIRVADGFNNRLQDYRLNGAHITDWTPSIAALGGAALAPDGRFVVPLFQDDSALAAFHHLGEGRAVRFGAMPVQHVVQRTPEEQWSDVRNGTIPQEMRNLHFPAIGEFALYRLPARHVESAVTSCRVHARMSVGLLLALVRRRGAFCQTS
jgi:hypothetical protein